jgi:hypothetical protein
MAFELSVAKKKTIPGWAGIGLIALTYIALYGLNYLLPFGY